MRPGTEHDQHLDTTRCPASNPPRVTPLGAPTRQTPALSSAPYGRRTLVRIRNSSRLMALALTSGLVLSACGGGDDASADGETYQWDFTVTTGNTSTWFEGAELFADQVEEESDGRITVNIFTNEQLSGGDPAAGVEQLMNGEKHLSFNSTIIYAGIDPKFGAVSAPFLYDNLEQARGVLEDTGIEAYTELSAGHGVHVLGMGESGFRQVTNSVRPINTPEDMAAIKIRIPGIGLFTDIYQTLGANPTTMNFAEVFTSLQQGTIEGQENPIDIIYSSGLDEVQDHLSIWNYSYDPLILGINKELYDSLSDEDKQIVDDAATAAVDLQISNNREKEAEQLEELKETMEVIELSPEDTQAFRDAVTPLYDEYTDVWGEDMVNALQPGE